MAKRRVSAAQRERAKQDELIRGGLHLLTLVTKCPHARKSDLYEWSARSARQVEQELSWCRREKLLLIASSSMSLTRLGQQRVVLNFIALQGGATVDQLERRFGFPRVGLVQICNELREQGHAWVAGALNFEPPLYLATQQGLAAVKREQLKVVPLSLRVEGHLRSCIDTAIRKEEEYAPDGKHGPHWEIWGERMLAQHNKGKRGDDRLASPPYSYGGDKRHKRPDLLLIRRFRGSDRLEVIAIENELTLKVDEELDAIFWAYQMCKSINVVEYHVSPVAQPGIEAARDRLETRIAEEVANGNLPPGTKNKFSVVPLPLSSVPAETRARFYEPQKLSGTEQRYRKAVASGRWQAELQFTALKVVEWITLQGVVTPDAVQIWLSGFEDRDAAELLELAHGAGWLHYSNILRGEGPMFFATPQGRRATGLTTPPFRINCRNPAHSLQARQLCALSRVTALLSRELPEWCITGYWEQQADSAFNGVPRLVVSASRQGLGLNRKADHLLLPPDGRIEDRRATLVIPQAMQGSYVELIIKRWVNSDIASYLYLYGGDPDVLRVAHKAVAELHAADEVSVRELPPSPYANEPVEDEGALKGCSLPADWRTAWTNT